MISRNIPVISITETTLAAAYEKALIELYNKGMRFKTQYDKPDDPLNIDSTMNITMVYPMIHRAFPGGIENLKEYVMELSGAKDHWVININDKEDTRWEYTYYRRIIKYGTWKELINGNSKQGGFFSIDQIEAVIEKLIKQPFTRQAQMITWMTNLDINCFDPPCLQSLWYRIIEDEEGTWWLNCNVRFRSNDAWGASFMNLFGFINFNKNLIADEISKRTGRKV